MIAPLPTDSDIATLIDQALMEDLGPDPQTGDITGQACINAEQRFQAHMRARQDMVVCGMDMAAAIFLRLDPNCTIKTLVQDGQTIGPGMDLMHISGRARGLLAAERTALNLVQHLSGIATLTATYVAKLANSRTRLLDTRKTLPGMRRLAKYACRCGGAVNHRMGLYDAVMIKDNHIAIAGSVTQAVERAQAAGHKHIQVECDTLAQVDEAIRAGADQLLLDNMSPNLLNEAMARINKRVIAEASGGITLDTIAEVAETGVDFISVGALTLSAPAVDIGLDFAHFS